MNPMIALSAKAPQFDAPPDPANKLMQLLQMKGAVQQQELTGYGLGKAKRQDEQTNALMTALQGGLDIATPEGQTKALTIAPEAAQTFIKNRLEGMNTQAQIGERNATADKAKLEATLKKFEYGASALSQVKDPASYAVVRNTLNTQLGMALPEQYDPATVQATIAQGQTITQQLQAKHQELTLAETTRHNHSTEGNQAATLAQTERHFQAGQNAPRGQFIETTNGYVLADPKTGSVRPVTDAAGLPLKGKAADRQMTDSQAKANLFGTRMKEADRLLSGLEGKYSPGGVNAKMTAGEVPLVGGMAGYAGNLMLSEEGQQAEQAQRDFINAVLRRESGAAIAPSEFSNAQKQYFPQPGDGPAVLVQKRRNRQMAIQGLEAEVPGGFRGAPHLTNPTGNAGGATGSWDNPAGATPKVVDFGSLR